MKNRTKHILILLLFILGAGLLGIYLQSTQEAIFFYREQQQLLQFDADYISNMLNSIGGLGTFITQCIVQFFLLPGMGAGLTAFIVGITAYLFWLTLRKIKPSYYLAPLAFLPALVQTLYLANQNYFYEGLVGLFVASLLLYLYTFTRPLTSYYRLAIGCLFSVALLLGFGSVGMLLALCICLFEAFTKQERWYLSLLHPVLLGIVGNLVVLAGKKPNVNEVVWMADYMDYFVELDTYYSLSWLFMLGVMGGFFLSGYLKWQLKGYLQLLIALLLTASMGYGCHKSLLTKINPDLYTMKQLVHYIETEQWDEILRCKEINMRNYLHLNCLNLALAKKDMLLSHLFTYPNVSTYALMAKYNFNKDEGMLLSYLYHHMGVTALAYDMAFGVSVGNAYGHPGMEKLIIKSHLIYGQYAAAEKHIRFMERTWGYADWAREQRRFLYNDDAVDSDPELGMMRKGLTTNKDLFANIMGIYDNMRVILEENPDNRIARDYLISSLLLTKDMQTVRTFVETYYGTDVLPALPSLLQQAVISYAEHEPDYCLKYGVSEEMLGQFAQYKQRVVGLRRANRDLASGMANYRGTFWYYLMFVN